MKALEFKSTKKTVSGLNPHPKNPRKITDKKLAQLKKSMLEFGDLSGIVFNVQTGNTVGGHQRTKNLEGSERIEITKTYSKPTRTGTTAIGFIMQDGEQFSYREVSWNENKEKAANIAANKGAGEWDMPQLTEWMKELQSFDVNFDMELTMFDSEELNDFGFTTVSEHTRVSPTTGVDEDDVPDSAKESICRVGDLFRLGSHRLLCGDATSSTQVQRLMKDQKADMVFTSPPYSDQRDYSGSLDLSPEKLSAFLEIPSDLFVVNLGMKREDGEVVSYWDIYIQKAKTLGLKLLSWNVWDKQQAGSVGNQTAMFPIEHEWIFVFGLKPKKLNKTEPCKWGGYRHNGIGSREKDGSLSEPKSKIISNFKPIGTIFRQTPEKNLSREDYDHPAVFPVAFPERYIEACVKDEALVIDPFLGSGSTLIACEKTNRKCFGMEIDPHYCDIIIERWEKYTGQKAKLIGSVVKLKKKAASQSKNSHAENHKTS